ANVRAVIARIEPAIESRLGEEIHLRTRLRVQQKRETRIKHIVDLGINEPGRGLFESIKFQIDSAAQPRAKIVLERGDREDAVEPVESLIHLEKAAGDIA